MYVTVKCSSFTETQGAQESTHTQAIQQDYSYFYIIIYKCGMWNASLAQNGEEEKCIYLLHV